MGNWPAVETDDKIYCGSASRTGAPGSLPPGAGGMTTEDNECAWADGNTEPALCTDGKSGGPPKFYGSGSGPAAAANQVLYRRPLFEPTVHAIRQLVSGRT